MRELLVSLLLSKRAECAIFIFSTYLKIEKKITKLTLLNLICISIICENEELFIQANYQWVIIQLSTDINKDDFGQVRVSIEALP